MQEKMKQVVELMKNKLKGVSDKREEDQAFINGIYEDYKEQTLDLIQEIAYYRLLESVDLLKTGSKGRVGNKSY